MSVPTSPQRRPGLCVMDMFTPRREPVKVICHHERWWYEGADYGEPPAPAHACRECCEGECEVAKR